MDRNQHNMKLEHHPLLKVAGGGDLTCPMEPPQARTIVSKRPWYDRLPEIFSVCWVTLILLGASFLVFYAVGMTSIKRHSLVVYNCNYTKPSSSNVFFHEIMQPGKSLPIEQYSDYISHMAKRYPNLNFQVIFIIDNSFTTMRQSKILSRFRYPKGVQTSQLEGLNYRKLKEFEEQFNNVNITVTTLSKFMSETPWIVKWKQIPVPYLTFYTRVFSIWNFGGIAMDLHFYNNLYKSRETTDKRVYTILDHHNKGIKEPQYRSVLKSIEHDEETRFYSMIYNMMTQLINETITFFNSNLTQVIIEQQQNPAGVRSQRHKREITDLPLLNITNDPTTNADSDMNTDTTRLPTDLMVELNSTKNTVAAKSDADSMGVVNRTTVTLNDTGAGEAHFFVVDIEMIPESVGPSLGLREPEFDAVMAEAIGKRKMCGGLCNYLTFMSEGLFIASTSRQHPLLSQLFFTGNVRLQPRHVIRETYLSQCPGMVRNDPYCSKIHILL